MPRQSARLAGGRGDDVDSGNGSEADGGGRFVELLAASSFPLGPSSGDRCKLKAYRKAGIRTA